MGDIVNKIDFLIKCARGAGWMVNGLEIITPDYNRFDAVEASAGILPGFDQDLWELEYFPNMIDDAINNINKRYVEGITDFHLSIFSDTIILYFEGQNITEYCFEKGNKKKSYSNKEKILQSYFNLIYNYHALKVV